jgi:hypothetical protein
MQRLTLSSSLTITISLSVPVCNSSVCLLYFNYTNNLLHFSHCVKGKGHPITGHEGPTEGVEV